MREAWRLGCDVVKDASTVKFVSVAAIDIRCDSKHAPRLMLGHERCSCRQVSKSSGFEVDVGAGLNARRESTLGRSGECGVVFSRGRFIYELSKKHFVPIAASWWLRVCRAMTSDVGECGNSV